MNFLSNLHDLESFNPKLKIKICGITNKDDLKFIEDFNADFIGFINVKRSPRYVSVDKINELLTSLKDQKKAVLVMEEKNPDEILIKLKKTSIKNVQIHSMTSDEIKILKEKMDSELDKMGKINLIGVIGLPGEISNDKKREIERFALQCDAILFDYQIRGKSGGTGKQIPLDMALNAENIAKTKNKKLTTFLAGGMDVSRLKTQGKTIKKYFDVVDLNSSLEDSPGIKNKSKIKETINQLKTLNKQD